MLISAPRKCIRIIRYKLYRLHWPTPAIFVFRAPRQMFLFWRYCFKMITSLTGKIPLNNTIFNPELGCFFPYIALCTPLSFDWWYFRWVHFSVRTIYITIFKVIITVGERHFILGIKTSLGGNCNKHGFWTGFYNLIAPIISICTCNISYETSTYAYTIIE